MTNPLFPNRMQQRRYEKWRNVVLFHVGLMAFVMGMMFISPVKAQAAVISQNTVGGTDGGMAQFNSGLNTANYLLGTGLSGTVQTIQVSVKRVGTSNKTFEVQLLCFDDAGYSTVNSGCSYNYYTGGASLPDSACAAVGAGGNGAAYSLKSCNPTTPLVLNPAKYYSLNLTGNGFAGTTLLVDYNAANTKPVYELDGIAGASATLTSSGSVAITEGGSVQFIAAWSNQSFTPWNLYFFQDVNDNFAYPIVTGFPMTGTTGNYTFRSTFPTASYPQAYHPYAKWGNSNCTGITGTGALTGSGCLTFSALAGSGITVRTPLQASDDTLHPSTMTGAKLNDVRVGDTDLFTYSINAPCTITGKRFFLGYAPALQHYDTGAILPVGNTGTYNAVFPRTNQPYSDFFFPYINVYCNDGTSKQLYLGSTWTIGKAQGVSVYTQVELNNRSDAVIPMLNGGAQLGFTTSSGSSFASNKRVYAKLEPVYLELNYHVPFTPASVLIFPTGTGAAGFPYSSGSTVLQQGRYLRTKIYYEVAGSYHPVVRVTGTLGETKNIFLGGNSYAIPYNQLVITADLWQSLGQLFTTKDGIFGLDPSTFSISFGASNNQFLSDAAAGVSKIVAAGLYVVNVGYNLLKSSPVISFFTDVIHPPNGATYVFPSKIGDFTIPYRPNTALYTISYASDSSGSKQLEYIIKLAAAVIVLRYVLKSFFTA